MNAINSDINRAAISTKGLERMNTLGCFDIPDFDRAIRASTENVVRIDRVNGVVDKTWVTNELFDELSWFQAMNSNWMVEGCC